MMVNMYPKSKIRMKRCWILLPLLLASCRGGGSDSRELMTANLSALETAVDMESRRVDGDDVLAFDEMVVDLGEVPLGESRTIRVEAENVAQKPVVVLEAYTSCDCTKVSFGKKPVRSGETIVFTVDFSADLAGTFFKKIAVRHSLSDKPVSFAIEGTVIKK